jgi:hypothetical protein
MRDYHVASQAYSLDPAHAVLLSFNCSSLGLRCVMQPTPSSSLLIGNVRNKAMSGAKKRYGKEELFAAAILKML